MKSLSREKIALIIFALLIVLGSGALIFYITGVGHSFNVAASKIDDVAGDLGDYTVLIYKDAEDAAAEQVNVTEVRNNFLHKKAAVYEVNVKDPEIYNEQFIVKAGKYRFGFINVDEITALPHYLSTRVKDYRASGVDFVVAVVDDAHRLNKIEGIDIVISTQDEGLKPIGVSSQGKFINYLPANGEVASILISPSKVISAKDISEL